MILACLWHYDGGGHVNLSSALNIYLNDFFFCIVSVLPIVVILFAGSQLMSIPATPMLKHPSMMC